AGIEAGRNVRRHHAGHRHARSPSPRARHHRRAAPEPWHPGGRDAARLMELLIAVALLGVTGVAVQAAWKVQLRADAAARLVLRSEARLAELRRLEQGRRSLADVQKIAEGTVEGGTRAVQRVHHG